METITIQSEAFLAIVSRMESIENFVKTIAQQQPLSEPWLDVPATCKLLCISKRTLQSYRDDGILSFSQIGGKIYFRVSDLEAHLKKHYRKAFKKQQA